MNAHLFALDGHVIVSFGENVNVLKLTPKEAEDWAKRLMELNEAARKQVQVQEVGGTKQ